MGRLKRDRHLARHDKPLFLRELPFLSELLCQRKSRRLIPRKKKHNAATSHHAEARRLGSSIVTLAGTHGPS